MNDIPKRGEIWLLNWNPSRGSEQAGIKPVLIIQNNVGNINAATTIVAAISSSLKLYPMNVLIEPDESGLKETSIVNTSQILTVSELRLEKKLGKLSRGKMEQVDRAIKLSLALNDF
ncbi:MAG TPA: type II toxin-antitoxin system PemK/MazF family toxin [Atribacterota bacterium]|nr:type II toxin-antitoxin system PemK/MazF family toxin [Atribacterota bacterium]